MASTATIHQQQQQLPPSKQHQLNRNVINKDDHSIIVTADGTTMYPKFTYPQPVPFSTLPASAGPLPSWEEKKLQLDMMNLNTDEDQGYVEPPRRPFTGDASLNGSSSSLNSSSRQLPQRPHTAGGRTGSNSAPHYPRDVSGNQRPQTAGSHTSKSSGFHNRFPGAPSAAATSSSRPNTSSGGERYPSSSYASSTTPRPHTSSGSPGTSPATSPYSQRSGGNDYSFPRPHTSSGGIGSSPTSFNEDGRTLPRQHSHGNFIRSRSSSGRGEQLGNSPSQPKTGFFSSLRGTNASSPSVNRHGLQTSNTGGIAGGAPSDVPMSHSRTGSNTSSGSAGVGYIKQEGATGTTSGSGAFVYDQPPKIKKNPLLRFLQKRFSGKYRRHQELQRQQQQQQGGQRGIGYTVPQPMYDSKHHGVSQSHNKTRSMTFAEKMRSTSGKTAQRINDTGRRWFKINSKTPKEDLPKTWDEWKLAYSKGMIDPNDIPAPPPSDPIPEGADPATAATPYQAQFLPGPLPDDQKARQIAFNRLDWRAKRGPKPSTIPVPEGEEPLPDTLEEHPAFRKIVAQARDTFDCAISIITVFNEDKQLFLAETGVNGLVSEMPREVSFCSHACLTKPLAPFTIKDTHEDWRFVNNPMVTQFGCRSYYGVPLLAPDFSGQDSQIPIGTLCVIDMKPRDTFTPEEKAKMGDLALLAQKTIANWSRARLNHRINLMEKSFQSWKSDNMLTLSGLQANGVKQAMIRAANSGVANRRIGNGTASDNPTTMANGSNLSLADSPGDSTESLPANAARQAEVAGADGARVEQVKARSRQGTVSSARNGALPSDDVLVISSAPTANNDATRFETLPSREPSMTGSGSAKSPPFSPRSEESSVALPAQRENAPNVEDVGRARSMNDVKSSKSAYHTAPTQPNNKQKIFDISTRLVATSLELDLVYILKLELHHGGASQDEVKVTGLNLLSSYGLPDPAPAFDSTLHLKALQSEEGGLLYQNPDLDELVSGEKLPRAEDVEYASALLVPIAESERAGYVLAGFTSDPHHIFERDDLLYMTTLASELSIYLQD